MTKSQTSILLTSFRFSDQRNRKSEAETERLKNELTEQVQLIQEHRALITELADALYVQRGSVVEDPLIQCARKATK
jgi:hypothetical protein